MTFPTTFSPDDGGYDQKGIYRYTLARSIGGTTRGLLNAIGVNPSKANELKNDPTVSRWMEFARRWGFAHLVVTNLFAFRATDPVEMRKYGEPVGPDNDHWIEAVASEAEMILCSWGDNGEHLGRGAVVATRLLRKHARKLYCLGHTAAGEPKHPLARGKSAITYEFQPIPLI